MKGFLQEHKLSEVFCSAPLSNADASAFYEGEPRITPKIVSPLATVVSIY